MGDGSVVGTAASRPSSQQTEPIPATPPPQPEKAKIPAATPHRSRASSRNWRTPGRSLVHMRMCGRQCSMGASGGCDSSCARSTASPAVGRGQAMGGEGQGGGCLREHTHAAWPKQRSAQRLLSCPPGLNAATAPSNTPPASAAQSDAPAQPQGRPRRSLSGGTSTKRVELSRVWSRSRMSSSLRPASSRTAVPCATSGEGSGGAVLSCTRIGRYPLQVRGT